MATFAVGLSRDLPANRVMRAQVNDLDLVVWRNSGNQLAAWDNRCPHRGMRLSHGFVRGDRLACLYHGWQFNATGRCAFIPAHPDLEPPATITTSSHDIAETGGVIWVAPDGPVAPPAMAPAQPLRSFVVACALADVEAVLPEAQDQGLTLFATAQGAATTQVHALIAPDADAATCKAASRWCEALRRRLETPQEAHA